MLKPRDCKICATKMFRKPNESTEYFLTKKYCSMQCSGRARSKRPAWNKGIPMERWVGEGNPNWKGGITPANKQIRHSIEYKQWRESVFVRDDYTCQFCKKRGSLLHADHIKPFAFFPKSRFDISNGRTLCKECHETTDTYKNNKITAKI